MSPAETLATEELTTAAVQLTAQGEHTAHRC